MRETIIINDQGELGQADKLRLRGQQVTVPSFEIFANPTVRISDVKRRRFNLIDRSVQTARQQIMSQEDDAIFKALDSIGSGNKEE